MASDTESDEPLFRLSESPAHLLRRAQQFASETFSDLGMSDGVTLRQSVVLAAVAEQEGLSQSDLVVATGIDRSTLADMIARMEARGLVTRSAAEDDARAKSVSLTNLGRDALEASLPAMKSVDAALMDILPKNRRKSFLDILRKLSDAADMDLLETNGSSKSKKKKKKKKKKKD